MSSPSPRVAPANRGRREFCRSVGGAALLVGIVPGVVGAPVEATASVAPLSAPSGRVILTVSGAISSPNAPDGTARFDRAMLEALGTASFSTRTPWHDGVVAFEGVPMAALMRAVGASGDTVVATALNDYSTDIPVADFALHGVLLALKRDGEYMPVRDKGPLFVVYPYDSDPALRSRIYHARSAWQVARLHVR